MLNLEGGVCQGILYSIVVCMEHCSEVRGWIGYSPQCFYMANQPRKKMGSVSQPIRYVAVTWAVIFTCPGSMGVGIAACVFMSAAPTLAFS